MERITAARFQTRDSADAVAALITQYISATDISIEEVNPDAPLSGTPGALIGATVGTLTGGLAGNSAAEAVNHTAEELFWRETSVQEPYYVNGRNFEYYAPGFRAGWEGRVRHDGRSFDAAEPDLKAAYKLTKGELAPDWQDVRPAPRAAWDRVDRGWKGKL